MDNMIGANPQKHLEEWCFHIVNLPAQKRPFKFFTGAEMVDLKGNYRGIALGEVETELEAKFLIHDFTQNIHS